MEKLFPAEAAAKGVTTGKGVARCVVGADGGLMDCVPLRGTPTGWASRKRRCRSRG